MRVRRDPGMLYIPTYGVDCAGDLQGNKDVIQRSIQSNDSSSICKLDLSFHQRGVINVEKTFFTILLSVRVAVITGMPAGHPQRFQGRI